MAGSINTLDLSAEIPYNQRKIIRPEMKMHVSRANTLDSFGLFM